MMNLINLLSHPLKFKFILIKKNSKVYSNFKKVVLKNDNYLK
jgi:hypothetical protein